MGIGDRYVYTMEGIGEKALIHGFLLKPTVSLFSAFSGVDCNYTGNLKKQICGPFTLNLMYAVYKHD